jgi:hypothetical protein
MFFALFFRVLYDFEVPEFEEISSNAKVRKNNF